MEHTMRVLLLLLLVVCALLGAVSAAVAAGAGESVASVEGEHKPSFLDFSVEDLGGNEVPLSAFAEYPVILVVNVASACGYTDQNYRELQALYEKHHDAGFTVLAFPCNQFARQEPGTPSEILQFVQDTYHVAFPVFSKVDVNGEDAHPLFKFLTSALPGFLTNDIKWNFSKFLVVDHAPFKRYGTSTSPFEIESDIVAALEASNSKRATTAAERHSDDL